MSKRKSSLKTLFTIPLSRVYWGRRSNRAKRAIKLIREFVKRQYKKAEKIIIDNSVNELVWSRGIEKPPRRIRVKVEYDEKEKVVKVFLPEKK